MAKPIASKIVVTPRVRRCFTLTEYRQHKADSTVIPSSSSVQLERAEGVDEEIPQEIPKINVHSLDESDLSFDGSDSEFL